ncbi:MAG: DUF6596 domain-containing protein [Pseudomonadota bacterium]
MITQARMDGIMRASYGRLLAILSSRSGDILRAEDALSDAFAKALIHWPDGMPKNPEAWLLTVARNRLTDIARRDARIDFRDELPELADHDDELSDFPDERLKLMFVCAHPAIDAGIHTPLMLQTVLGLDAQAIAQAFLVPHATMAKRLVRAKRKIRDTSIAFHIPENGDLIPRLSVVLEAIYGAFSRDWFAAGALAEEAFYLATLLTDFLPDEAEVRGLAALMAYTLSRENARVRNGQFVPLEEQDPTQWDRRLLDVARMHLTRAQAQNGVARFQLEAAIQAVHADRLYTGVTDWDALVQLHLGLSRVAPTIGATVSYAAAVGKAVGPKEGLYVLEAVDPKIHASFAPAEATKAYLLSEMGQSQEAVEAYQRAISLTAEQSLRQYLQAKSAALLAS